MTEFAMVIPIILLLLLGLFDLGHVIFVNASLANAAREGARYAIVRGGSATSSCPVGPPAASAVIPPPSSSCPYPSPSKQAVVDVATGQAIAAGSDLTVTVCYGSGCSGNTDAAGATNARGTPVTVRVSGTIPLVTMALLGQPPYAISGETTMIVSH